MRLFSSALSRLVQTNPLRSFTGKRVLVVVGFSVVGALLDYSDVIVSEGQLVMATFTLAGFLVSLVMQHRKDARFPVLMHAVYAYPNSTAGEGVAESLSVSGCKLRSMTPAPSGSELRLELYPANEVLPIEIEKAFVRWTSEGQFGVQFSKVGQGHQERLRHLINQLS